MSNKRKFYLFYFLILSLILTSCSSDGIAGIDRSVKVKRVNLLISEVKTIDSLIGNIEMNFQTGELVATTITPVNPFDTFLFVEASTTYKGKEDPCTWSGEDAPRISFDKEGKSTETDLFECYSDYEEGYIRFYFPTYSQGATNYFLLLPNDIKISLDGLMQ